MAYLIQERDYVKYICSCGKLKPITSLYFCQRCLKIRCEFCVYDEVYYHYCDHCYETVPNSANKNQCDQEKPCYDCPSCFHSLSIRIRLIQLHQTSAEGEKQPPIESFYLRCSNCFWTTFSVGIPDQPIAFTSLPERPIPNQKRITQLQLYHLAIAERDKLKKSERQREMVTDKGKGATKHTHNIAGPSSDGGASSSQSIISDFVPSQATTELEELPDDIYTKEVDLNEITSLFQRLSSPAWQPVLTSQLYPPRKALSAKLSQRCRTCQDYLAEPDAEPTSINFKTKQLAFHLVPEVRLTSHGSVPTGSSLAVITITNHSEHELTVRLIKAQDVPSPAGLMTIEEQLDEILDLEKDIYGYDYQRSKPSYKTNCTLFMTDEAITIPACGDSPRHEKLPCFNIKQLSKDIRASRSVVVWRNSNKVAVWVTVMRDGDAVEDAPALATLGLQYRTALAASPLLYATVLLELGTITAAGDRSVKSVSV